MRTDGRTDMKKLIVAFRNFANEPNCSFLFQKGNEEPFPVHITREVPSLLNKNFNNEQMHVSRMSYLSR